jgi:nitrite reductase (NO-forming)
MLLHAGNAWKGLRAGSVLLAATLSLSACGAGSPAASGPAGASLVPDAQAITIKGLDTLRFDPATITVPRGQVVQVTFDSAGQIVHDFTLREGVAKPVQAVAAGGREAITPAFSFEQPGTYTFICAQPGHEAGGMHGTITVQ